MSNPAGSKLLVIIEAIVVSPSAAGVVQVNYQNGGQVAAAYFSRDQRNTARSTTIIQGIHGALVNASPVVWRENVSTSQALGCCPLIMPPGTFLTVNTETANVGLIWAIRWRERPAQPSELE